MDGQVWATQKGQQPLAVFIPFIHFAFPSAPMANLRFASYTCFGTMSFPENPHRHWGTDDQCYPLHHFVQWVAQMKCVSIINIVSLIPLASCKNTWCNCRTTAERTDAPVTPLTSPQQATINHISQEQSESNGPLSGCCTVRKSIMIRIIKTGSSSQGRLRGGGEKG